MNRQLNRLAVVTVVDHAVDIAAGSKSLISLATAPPPDWVESLPLVGSKIAAEWRRLAADGAKTQHFSAIQ